MRCSGWPSPWTTLRRQTPLSSTSEYLTWLEPGTSTSKRFWRRLWRTKSATSCWARTAIPRRASCALNGIEMSWNSPDCGVCSSRPTSPSSFGLTCWRGCRLVQRVPRPQLHFRFTFAGVLLVSDGQPFDEGFDAWQSGGTEILNDTLPPQPANGGGTVCLGVYKKIGPRTYKLKHPFWSFDANANLAGSGVLGEIVTLDAG